MSSIMIRVKTFLLSLIRSLNIAILGTSVFCQVLLLASILYGMTPRIRFKMYAFFMKHFDLSGDPAEEEVSILSAEVLQVTSSGQISSSLGGGMVFDVHKRETEELIKNLEQSGENIKNHLSGVMVEAKDISGFAVSEDPEYEPFLNGRYQRDGYTVGKYAIKAEGDYVIPLKEN